MVRALVVRLDNDGDVLLAGPAIRAVASGTDHVTLLCGPRGARAAELLPGVDEVLVRRAEWIDPEPRPVVRDDILDIVDHIAAVDASAAVILTSSHQSPLPTALILRMAGVRSIAAISEDYPGSLLDVRVREPGDVHEVQRALGVAAALGFELPAGDDRCLHVRAAEPAVALPSRFVAVHPGASVSARAWSVDALCELVTVLLERGREVVVTGGPDEAELTATVAGAPRPGVHDVGGRTTFAQLAGVLARADALVVGNTGPSHLAAAVGTPVVSLFALTVPPERWRPWGVPHLVLNVPVPCAGCRARTCPMYGHPCLSGVAVVDVVAAVDRVAPMLRGVAA
ncbi:MAG: glycosyl transferase, family 9 [Solirubrobacterales bacterium]|nr:glycosyl transferase, family 9 [Solirubrobacterales bacterium]